MGKVYSPEEFPVPCEVWSRPVGYLSVVQRWNDGKQAEFRHRKTFDRALKEVDVGAEKDQDKDRRDSKDNSS